MSIPACRTASTPTTVRATARTPPRTAGSACWPGSRRTGWLSAKRRRKQKRPPPAAFSFRQETLVGVDARFLDDRRPLVDLGLQVLLQRGRGRFLGRIGRRAELGEALLHRLVLERCLQRGDELVGHRFLQALWRVKPVPDADLEALEALLVKRRDLLER